MAEFLVFSEQEPVALELLTKGRELAAALNMTLSVVVPGVNAADRTNEYAAYGAQKVYVSKNQPIADLDAEGLADVVAQVAKASGATAVLLGSSKRGKELAGRVAQKLGCGAVTDATSLQAQDGKLVVGRYALGGNTLATDLVTTDCQVIAVMPKTFQAVPQPGQGQVIPLELNVPSPRVKVVERKPKPITTANIEGAETLVVVGKGFAKQEDLQLAHQLADALRAEVGCTRTLSADYHWLGEERMVGISGKKCKPRLMISAGVSGQIQHTVGILGSKLIVAINKDKGAPIFKVADYGIVGDLYQVLPKLTDQVKRAKTA